jgi:2,5-diketo-D-gluconate reductase A
VRTVSKSPLITLNNGTTIPQLGFGTLGVPPDRQPSRANTEMTAQIVGLALEVGYRHIDTAQMYGNEHGVGEAIAPSGIPREELYGTSKLGNGNHRPDDVRRSFDETLEKLGLEQPNLFLMHWPLPTLYDGDYVSTWEAMCELVAEGRLRTAGVSNFQPAHLDRIIAETGYQRSTRSRCTRTSPTAPLVRLQPVMALRWRRGVRPGRASCSITT